METRGTSRRMGIVSFTPGGDKQAERVKNYLTKQQTEGWQVEVTCKPASLKEWCGRQFQESDAILFVGAMGIAVRVIAPYIKSKLTDPAVLVMDEKGQFIIPMLSGHIGGANELACEIADGLGAIPVLTTASDVNHKLAVDVFAVKNHLFITDMHKAREAAANIVAGKTVSLSCDGKIKGKIPEELDYAPSEAEFHICITENPKEPKDNVLYLVPKCYVLGIGCRRGKTMEEIEQRVQDELKKYGISMQCISGIGTIDLKKDEEGLAEFGKKYDLPIVYYTAQELMEVPGEYKSSEFVKNIAGVDNVCERAAMKLAEKENPQIVVEKTGKDGVTVAVARRDWSVYFE